MYALTVYAPWAHLIMTVIDGVHLKPYELRKHDFSAPKMVKGRMVKGRPELIGRRIVIHAATRKIVPAEVHELIERLERKESVVAAQALPMLRRVMDAHKCEGVLPLACGLGTATLGRPKTVAQLFTGSKFFDSDRANHQLFGWPMLDPKPFPEPIPMRGLQGFWTWPALVPDEAK